MIFYFRPELQYTKVSSQFENNLIYNSRIEIPVSFDLTLLGPVSGFLGPTFFYGISQKTNDIKLDDIKDKMTFGLHVGSRLKLGPGEINVRYLKGVSDIESNILSRAGVTIEGKINNKPNQLILWISVQLN